VLLVFFVVLERSDDAAGSWASDSQKPGSGGGCLLFYCQSDREHEVRRALEKAGAQIVEFNFDTKGVQTWIQG